MLTNAQDFQHDRPQFTGAQTVRAATGDGFWITARPSDSVDAGTAELRQRILGAGLLPRLSAVVRRVR
jgi:hypothetical protein